MGETKLSENVPSTLKGIRVAVSPDFQPQLPNASLPPNAPKNEEAMRMRQWLTTPAGRALYILRKMTVEPVFESNQRSARYSEVPATLLTKRAMRMETDLGDPQSSKAVPL